MKKIPEFVVVFERKPLPEQEFGDCRYASLTAKTTIEAMKEVEKLFSDETETPIQANIIRKRIAICENPWYTACKDLWFGEKEEEEILFLDYLQTKDGKQWQVVYNDTEPNIWGRYFPEEEAFTMPCKPKKWLTNW